jgi:hypothetical protein
VETSLPQLDTRLSGGRAYTIFRRHTSSETVDPKRVVNSHNDPLHSHQSDESLELTSSVASQSDIEAYPCFFHRDCGGTAEVEKQGKSVCKGCAARINGSEYPLRKPCREPLYPNVRDLILQLGMKESGLGGFEV